MSNKTTSKVLACNIYAHPSSVSLRDEFELEPNRSIPGEGKSSQGNMSTEQENNG